MRKSHNNEKHVKADIKELLDKHGWFWWMPPANAYGKNGISDFHATKSGVFMAIEAKFGKNKPTELQKAFLESIRAEDGFGFVVDEERIWVLDEFLKSFAASTNAVGHEQRPKPEDGAAMLNAIRILTHDS